MNADARGFNLGCHPERSEAESRDLGVPASCLLPPVSCFGMPTVFDPASYEQMSDGALLRIAMERDELTPDARAALEAQLAKRGLKQHDVAQFADTYRAEVAEDEKGSPSRAWGFGTGFDRWPVWPSTSGTIGTVFYGRRDLKEMNNRQQYQATRWFCVLWIPLIPLGTYIVHRTTTTWLGLFDDVRRIRKVPLDWEQVFKTWAVAALVVAGLWFFGPKVLVWSLGR
jgi:hypothetical protein